MASSNIPAECDSSDDEAPTEIRLIHVRGHESKNSMPRVKDALYSLEGWENPLLFAKKLHEDLYVREHSDDTLRSTVTGLNNWFPGRKVRYSDENGREVVPANFGKNLKLIEVLPRVVNVVNKADGKWMGSVEIEDCSCWAQFSARIASLYTEVTENLVFQNAEGHQVSPTTEWKFAKYAVEVVFVCPSEG